MIGMPPAGPRKASKLSLGPADDPTGLRHPVLQPGWMDCPTSGGGATTPPPGASSPAVQAIESTSLPSLLLRIAMS